MGILAVTIALPATACSDDFDPLGLDDTSTTGDPEPPFDYSACSPPMQDPWCVGSECGRTPEAQDYLAIMLEVVAEAGRSDVFAPTDAEYAPFTDELRIDYQLQVSWFRIATTVHFDVPDTEELLRQEMASHVDGWRIPLSVAARQTLTNVVAACNELLEYDPCTDNQPDFYVHDGYDWAEPDCLYKSTYVVVDAADASTLECAVEEPQACE